MIKDYRKARKGELTCDQCRHSMVRAIGGRLECQVSPTRHPVVGSRHTCDKVELRGAQ